MTTASDFLSLAKPGGAYVYFVGHLAPREPHPDKLLDACVLYVAAQAGAVALVQRRVAGGYEYIAQAGPQALRNRLLVAQYHMSGQNEAAKRSEQYRTAGMTYAGRA